MSPNSLFVQVINKFFKSPLMWLCWVEISSIHSNPTSINKHLTYQAVEPSQASGLLRDWAWTPGLTTIPAWNSSFRSCLWPVYLLMVLWVTKVWALRLYPPLWLEQLGNDTLKEQIREPPFVYIFDSGDVFLVTQHLIRDFCPCTLYTIHISCAY